MASFSTTFPHLAEGQGLLLTGKVSYQYADANTGQTLTAEMEETLLGIGQFEPEQDYALTKNTNVLQKQTNGEYIRDDNGQIKTKRPVPSTQDTIRNAAFLFAPNEKVPNENGVYLFRNINEFIEDDQSKFHKILKAIEKIKWFNMVGYNSQGVETPYYAVFLDTPNKDPSVSSKNYFHQDQPAGAFLEPFVKKTLQDSGITHVVPSRYVQAKQSKYTCIEYGNECLSTTVKNPYIPGDIIRFVACPGTVLCVENTTQQHSTPFDTSAYTTSESITDPITEYQTSYTGFDRGPGNQYLQQTVPSGRKLYRTQYVPVTLEEARLVLSKLQHGKDYVFISLESVMPAYHALQPFGSMPMTQYVSNPAYRTQERGGKRKKKMSRRLKKTFNKKPRKSKKNHN